MPTDYRHTDKHLRLGMPLIALYCESVHGQTDGRYQVHYLPRFAVDKLGFKGHSTPDTILLAFIFNIRCRKLAFAS